MKRRNLPYCALVLCLAGVCASTVQLDSGGPLEKLPSGWVYLPRSYIDAWTGAYHDAVSGAYVSFIVGERVEEIEFWTSLRQSESDNVITNGEVAGIPYRTVRVENPRDKLARHLEGETGQPIEELSSLMLTLPPPSCPVLVVSYIPTDVNVKWAFTAALCNGLQETRVSELLLSQLRIRLQKDRPSAGERTRRLTEAQFQAVVLGSKVVDLLEMLGPPADSYRISTDGFAVTYPVSRQQVDRARNGTLVFDRLQTLTEKELEQ